MLTYKLLLPVNPDFLCKNSLTKYENVSYFEHILQNVTKGVDWAHGN